MIRKRLLYQLFAGCFGCAVYIERRDHVVLRIQSPGRSIAVEHVVGADIDAARFNGPCDPSHEDRADGIHPVSLCRILLAPVDLMKGGAVYDDSGPEPLERRFERGDVSDVDILMTQADLLDSCSCCRVDEITAELSGRSDDDERPRGRHLAAGRS